MVDDIPPRDLDEPEHDDLAALDFCALEQHLGVSDLDALAGYEPEEDDELPPMFTVANPPGSVTVTTFMDGRVQHVDLSPKVTTMTETLLAEEIVVIADLATQDARSAQYSVLLEEMREQGHDNVATRDFLGRDLNLPSPEQARQRRTELFATRYVGRHD